MQEEEEQQQKQQHKKKMCFWIDNRDEIKKIFILIIIIINLNQIINCCNGDNFKNLTKIQFDFQYKTDIVQERM
jgi:hypothetical protein